MLSVFGFLGTCVLFGLSLSLDGLSLVIVDVLHEPHMSRRKCCLIAGSFSFFQAFVPLAGWYCHRNILQDFDFAVVAPWFSLALLWWIGGVMIVNGLSKKEGGTGKAGLGAGSICFQAIVTSFDALSIGGTDMAGYSLLQALACAGIIAAVTWGVGWGGFAAIRAMRRHFAGRCPGTSGTRQCFTKHSGRGQVIGGIFILCIGVVTCLLELHM